MREYQTRDSVIRLHDVVGGYTHHLPSLLRLLPEFFPDCEKFLPLLQQRAALTPSAMPVAIHHQWVVEVDGEAAGFYLFDYLPGRACGLTLFIGLYPQFRHLAVDGYTRLAHFLIAESVRQIHADAARLGCPPPIGLAVEVEVLALLSRYHLYDFVELPVVYYEPMFPEPWFALSDGLDLDAVTYEHVSLGLFHAGLAPRTALTAADVANLASAFLIDFYKLPNHSLPVQQALATAQPIEWM